MLRAQPRFESARHGFIDQQSVELHRDLGQAHPVALGRDAGVQIGQRLAIVEPGGIRHKTFDQLQHAPGAVDETAQHLMAVDAATGAALIEPGFGAGGVFRRRQPA